MRKQNPGVKPHAIEAIARAVSFTASGLKSEDRRVIMVMSGEWRRKLSFVRHNPIRGCS